MRQSLMARLLLILASVLAVSFVAAAHAQEPPTLDQVTTGPARIAVIHAAPFGPDTRVTVVANDAVILTNNFEFGDVVPHTTLPAATYNIKVYAGVFTVPMPPGQTPVLQASVPLLAGRDYTVVAVGTGGTFPLDLRLIEDNTPLPASATAKLRVAHVAPFASSLELTQVFVRADGTMSPITGLDDLRYRDVSEYLTLPSDTPLDLEVVRASDQNVLIDLDPITLASRSITTVYAIGGGSGDGAQPPAIIAQRLVPRGPSQVRLVHASPFAAPGASTVTVQLTPLGSSTSIIVTNSFDFGDILPYQPLAPGIYVANIFAGTTATGTPVLTTPLNVPDGGRFTVVAMGLPGNTVFPLQLKVLDDVTVPPPSASAKLRVLHAAPFAATVPQTAVDVVAQNGSPLNPPVTDIVYDELTDYLTLPSGVALDVKITPSGRPNDPAVIDPLPFTLGGGSVTTLIAVGGPNNNTARLLVLDDLSQTVRLFLPIIGTGARFTGA